MKPETMITAQRNVVHLKQLQRASRDLTVIAIDQEQRRYLVGSAHNSEHQYQVTLDADTATGQCTCPWAQHGGINCKHVLAALREHHAGQGALSFWKTPSDARRQHRHTLEGDGLYVTLRPSQRERRWQR